MLSRLGIRGCYELWCGCGHGSQAMLLWHSLAAVALILPLALELPYATNVALKNKTKQNTEKRKNKTEVTIFNNLILEVT